MFFFTLYSSFALKVICAMYSGLDISSESRGGPPERVKTVNKHYTNPIGNPGVM